MSNRKKLTLAVKKFFKKDLKVQLPVFYVLILIISGFLFLLFQIYPQLTICSKLFGVKFCTPTGAFLALLVSLPGYFVAGDIMGITPKTPLSFSIPVVFLVTLIFYFLLGVAIDFVRKTRPNLENAIKYLVIVIFILLLTLYIFLR